MPSPPPALDPLPPRRTGDLRLPTRGLEGRDRRAYLPDPGLIAAANAAIMLGSPLLLTGEPGCGKTDFAHAIAHYLDSRRDQASRQGLRECYVRSDTRARDLLYQYDALRRFGDAQHGDDITRRAARDPRLYIELQPLGLALVAPIRQVVLIDEIDKAPRDLPNDLLRELECGEFEIPEVPAGLRDGAVKTAFPPWGDEQQPIQRFMRRPAGADRRPIIIITSNVERQLPDPFLRRCLFYHIRFPDPERLLEILVKRHQAGAQQADAQPRAGDTRPLFQTAITLFTALRAQPGLYKKPSTAELLDWVDVLSTAYEGDAVHQRLALLTGDLSDATPRFKSRSWRDVPAIECLVKLREDIEALG